MNDFDPKTKHGQREPLAQPFRLPALMTLAINIIALPISAMERTWTRS
jgi:hypothetical protein